MRTGMREDSADKTAGASINRSMTLGQWGMLAMLSIIWGGSFFFIGVAVADIPPLTIVAIRVLLAAMVLWLIMVALRQSMPRDPSIWGTFFCMGFLNNVLPFSLIVWGQTYISSGLASILNATTPLFTILVAGGLLADERITLGKAVGVLLGLAGVVVIVGPEAMGGMDENVLAQLAVLAAGVSYAFAGVYGRRFRTMGMTPFVTATGQVTASSVLLLPLALSVDRPWEQAVLEGPVWAALAGLGILSTAFAYILYFRLLATAGATNLLLVTFLVPVSAVLLGILFLGEHLAAGHVAGMALIASGLLVIDGRLLPRRRPSEP